MKGFRNKRDQIVAKFEGQEQLLLTNLVEQFIALLEDMEPEQNDVDGFGYSACAVDERLSDDPFAAWEAEFEAEQPSFDRPVDPVIARLFPDAYLDDQKAADEFRRFTQSSQRSAKLAEAYTMLADLKRPGKECSFTKENFYPWLKTLTNLRLALATRLGIVDATSSMEIDEMSSEDPRAPAAAFYHWLGWVQEALLMAGPS